MFPAPNGIVANYKYADTDHRYQKRVIAFGDDGRPFVIPERGTNLVPADSGSNYIGMSEDPYPPLVSMIPADGWRIEWIADDGCTNSAPLAGWGLRANGDVVPLETDSSGFCVPLDTNDPDFADRASGKVRIFHPDVKTSEQASEQTTTKESDVPDGGLIFRLPELPIGGLIGRPGETSKGQTTDPKETA